MDCVSCSSTQFTYKNSISIEEQNYQYEVCVDKCPTDRMFVVNTDECVEQCNPNIFDGITFECLSTTAGCTLVNNSLGYSNCTTSCDFYNETSKLCIYPNDSSCDHFELTQLGWLCVATLC